MARRNIILIPDPVLKARAHAIENIDDAVRAQARDMIDTMYAAPGVGLAANQIGQLNRLIVMDTEYKKEDPETRKPIVMINPEIIWESEQRSVWEEGCLSIPRQYADVERPASVRVRYVTLEKEIAEFEASELASHCVQHEIDHLNGILFIDHLSRLKRSMLLRRFEKSRYDDEGEIL